MLVASDMWHSNLVHGIIHYTTMASHCAIDGRRARFARWDHGRFFHVTNRDIEPLLGRSRLYFLHIKMFLEEKVGFLHYKYLLILILNCAGNRYLKLKIVAILSGKVVGTKR